MDALQARKDLELELAEKEATQQRLQDEVEYVLLVSFAMQDILAHLYLDPISLGTA